MRYLLYFKESIQNEIDNLSEDDKMKVWLDYMVTQTALNNHQSIHKAPNDMDFDKFKSKFNKIKSAYPNLGAVTSDSDFKIKINSFEDFCTNTNPDKADNIQYWYWRFKKRIFN